MFIFDNINANSTHTRIGKTIGTRLRDVLITGRGLLLLLSQHRDPMESKSSLRNIKISKKKKRETVYIQCIFRRGGGNLKIAAGMRWQYMYILANHSL